MNTDLAIAAVTSVINDIVGNAAASTVQTTKGKTPTGTDRQGELYQAGLTMAWELDLCDDTLDRV